MGSAVFGVLPADASPDRLLRLRCDSQSVSFYADLSAYLCRTILGHEKLSLLDVGPRTGSGLAMLRLMHHPFSFSRLRLDPVHGIDIDKRFFDVASVEFEDIRAIVGDVRNLEPKSYDLVTCSHTVEHVPEPAGFLELLERVARRAVVIACPFEEEKLIPGHVNRIDRTFLSAVGYDDVHVYESHQWHGGLCCLAKKELG